MSSQASNHSADKGASEGEDMTSRGGSVPHGTELRGKYLDNEFTARIEDGYVVWNNEKYESLTAAAVAAKKSAGAEERRTSKVTANGWTFWKRQDPSDGQWKPCQALRSISRESG